MESSKGGEEESEGASPAARLFQAPRFNCHIIAMIGCQTRIDSDSLRLGLLQSLLHHPRFSSILQLAELMEKKERKGKWGWGNRIAYVLVPLKIALEKDPLLYILKAKATIDRKKLSLQPFFTYAIAKFILLTFGVKVASSIAHRFISNTTLAFSNVVGPLEDISFYGHPISFLAPSVYGHPQALTIHFQSYGKKMTMVVAVDPDVIPNPHRLLQHLEDSLLLIRDSILAKGLDIA